MSERFLNVICTAWQSLDITALMPRHQAHSRPRHRVPRQGSWSGRYTRFSAGASCLIRTSLVAVRTVKGIIGHREYCRVAHGAFLAPWFAVGLGIVAAAGLTLAMPRAALTFPPSTGGQCVLAGCANTRHSSGPSKASTSSQVTGHRSRRRSNIAAVRHPLVSRIRASGRPIGGLQVWYGVLSKQPGHFVAMFVITGREPLGKWVLQADIPGARITAVMWGKWGLERSGAIVIDGKPSPWPRSAPNQARVVVFGSGEPLWPGDCVYNGARCVFRPLVRA